MGPFTPEAYGDFKYVSKTTDQFTRWTAVYLLDNKNCAFDTYCLLAISTAIPCGGRVIRWRADKGGEYTSEAFKPYCLETGTTQEFAATNTPQQNGMSERVGRTLVQYGSLPSRRQWTPVQIVGGAHAHCGLPPQPYARLWV